MTSALTSIAEDLWQAVDGVDWDAQRVQSLIESLHREADRASREALDAALAVIAGRVARARIEDADGVAHAAISGGALVEWGARPRPLADALLSKLPDVLVAARRYADACIAARRRAEGAERDGALIEVEDPARDRDRRGGVRALPMNEVVWREGLPTDVPELDGVRTLVATHAAIQRGWRASRPFHAMVPEVTVTRELPRADAERLVAEMRARADALVGAP